MKKAAVTILALLYLTLSSGAMVTVHYCMGQLVDRDFSQGKKNCPKCGMQKAAQKGCCKNEHKQLKIDDQRAVDVTVSLWQLTSVVATPAFSEFFSLYVPSLTEEHPLANAPPRPQNIPLFIRNCVFRI